MQVTLLSAKKFLVQNSYYKRHLFSLLIILNLVIGCDDGGKVSVTKSKKETISKSALIKTASFKERNLNFEKADQISIEDSVKLFAVKQKGGLKQQMQWLISEWRNAPNPLMASYEGNDFGDYHHIIFKTSNGKLYDFGQAKNNYGNYQLHEPSGQYTDDPKYLKKQFRIFWTWKLSDFLCCNGDYAKAKAYLPTITKLELIKK